ncbi:MAG TPA: nucleoside-diphosphate kinase [Candidatus Binataceae bacterium]|jgi:nucleoside-diphosphate kinase|nr:nucleoside-diphosphate kinase [Candidatus Binataceae bacterium]
MERTLAIIKPDAVERNLVGEIIKRIEAAGLRLCALRIKHLTRREAERFYEVHQERPFFKSLCDYMTSGPIVIAVLGGDNAIKRWRELMGATDPAKAAPGTIRNDFGLDVEKNASHGSDAPETAAREVAFFFSAVDLVD